MMPYGIAFELKMLDNRIHRMMDARTRVKELGITPEQLMILRYISDHEDRDVYQRDFETDFGVSRATVSNTLKLMEGKRLITREGVPQDARLKKLTLTSRALEIHERATEAIMQINRALEGALTEEEQETWKRLFNKLNRALDGMAEDER